MKKWFIGILILVVLTLSFVYIFFPSKLNIVAVTLTQCTQSGGYRVMADTANWKNWWPDSQAIRNGDKLSYGNYSYTITQVLQNTFILHQEGPGLSVTSTMNLLPFGRDSLLIEWKCAVSAGNNPIKRVYNYWRAVEMKKNMDQVLERLKSFLQVPVNVYGIAINESSTTDTLLIATRKSFPNHPSTDEIYQMIGLLKQYTTKEGLLITGNPMVNVTPITQGRYDCMTAIPVNKEINARGTIFFRRMIPGNFLTTIVKGGDFTIANAVKQMKFFMSDYQKTSMAINFQSLITDRIAVKDTSKWETKLYEPVMK